MQRIHRETRLHGPAAIGARLVLAAWAALAAPGGVLRPQAELAPPPRLTIHLFNIDQTAIVRLNNAPVAIAGYGQNVFMDITPSVQPGANVLTLEFDAAASAQRGSYGYRVEIDGQTVITGECGRAGKAPCIDLVAGAGARRPSGSGLVENNRVMRAVTWQFTSERVPGQIAVRSIPEKNASWAGAAAILLGWKLHRPLSPDDAAKRAGARYAAVVRSNSALTAAEQEGLRRSLALESVTIRPLTASTLPPVIHTRGPLWLDSPGCVIYALIGDGSDEHTYVKFLDLAAGAPRTETLARFKQQLRADSTFVVSSAK